MSAPTEMLSSVTTPTSLSSHRLKRRFVKKTLRRNAPSPSSREPTMRQWRSATLQWRRCAMVRDRRSAGQCTRAAAAPSMLRSSLASLWETPSVRSCQLSCVEQAAPMKRVMKSVMRRWSPLSLMFLRRSVISTLRRPADTPPNLFLS